MTGNLYRPTKVDGKLQRSSTYAGTAAKGSNGNKTAFQNHGMWFASNGYVCLIIDTLHFGEVAGKHHGTYNLIGSGGDSLGYTPAGRVLERRPRHRLSGLRPEVDADRIGVTGISGGGASTIWIAAADERVKVAVPVSGMSDLESYVANRIINGHCDCMLLVKILPVGWTHHRLDRTEAHALRQFRHGSDFPDGRQPPHHRPAARLLQDACAAIRSMST